MLSLLYGVLVEVLLVWSILMPVDGPSMVRFFSATLLKWAIIPALAFVWQSLGDLRHRWLALVAGLALLFLESVVVMGECTTLSSLRALALCSPQRVGPFLQTIHPLYTLLWIVFGLSVVLLLVFALKNKEFTVIGRHAGVAALLVVIVFWPVVYTAVSYNAYVRHINELNERYLQQAQQAP